MLTLTHRYRIYPDAIQEQQLIEWMEICRGAYNYALREIKDWCDSRKCPIDRCSLQKEYILPADLKFPNEVQQLNNLPKANILPLGVSRHTRRVDGEGNGGQ